MNSESIKFNIWVTTSCNLNCKYCYEGTNKNNIFMSKDIAINTVNFIVKETKRKRMTKCIIHFHGGEPLLAFDIIKYITTNLKKDFKSEIDLHFSITTNGTILNQEIKNFLIMNFNTISVSIDGTQSSHDSNRKYLNGFGSHELAIKNSIKLAKHIKILRIRMTVTPDNVFDLFDNIKYLINIGFIFISPQVDFFSKLWTEELFLELNNQINKTREYIKNTAIAGLTINMVNKNGVYNMGTCTGGISNLNIDPQGFIYPCTFTVGNEEFRCGSIFNGVLKKKVEEYQKINDNPVLDCIGCNYYQFCITSKCKFINKCITGNYYRAPVVLCAIENLKLRNILSTL